MNISQRRILTAITFSLFFLALILLLAACTGEEEAAAPPEGAVAYRGAQECPTCVIESVQITGGFTSIPYVGDLWATTCSCWAIYV